MWVWVGEGRMIMLPVESDAPAMLAQVAALLYRRTANHDLAAPRSYIIHTPIDLGPDLEWRRRLCTR